MTASPLMIEVALPVFMAMVMAVVAVWRLATPARSAVNTRLDAIGPARAARAHRLRERWAERWADWATQAGHRFGWRRGGGLEQTLQHAGFRGESAFLILRLTQLVITAVGVATALLWMRAAPMSTPTVIIVTCLWGYVLLMLPVVIVRLRATERQRAIAVGLPGTLDLVVVCLEAGLGLDAAIVRVAAEISPQNHILGGELLTVSREVQAGIPRREALRNLVDRTGVPEIAALVAILTQTERLGTSVARALRTQAESARERQRQRVEEEAAKTAVKIVFPLAFCIFPALFLVVLGPALIGLARLFLGLGR